jgi:hypothetical protein
MWAVIPRRGWRWARLVFRRVCVYAARSSDDEWSLVGHDGPVTRFYCGPFRTPKGRLTLLLIIGPFAFSIGLIQGFPHEG